MSDWNDSTPEQPIAVPATERLLLHSGSTQHGTTPGTGESAGSVRPTMAGLAAEIAAEHQGDDPKVVNLAYYRIKKSLKQEGFDLITDDKGKLTLVLRVGR